MHQITLLFIDEYISIMPVFYLQDVWYYGISCLWFYEILSCLLEHTVVFRAKVANEKLIQWLLIGFTYGVPWYSLGNNLDYATNIEGLAGSVGYGFIRKQLQIQIIFVEYLHKQLDDLQS